MLKHAWAVCRRRYQPSYRASYLGYSSADTSDSEEDGAEDKLDAEKEVDAEEEVMEMQWKSYVDKLRQSGELSSCLAVADVSGSMTGEPMNVSSSIFHPRRIRLLQFAGCHLSIRRGALVRSPASTSIDPTLLVCSSAPCHPGTAWAWIPARPHRL